MAYELFDSKSARIGSPALTVVADERIALNADVGDILVEMGAKFVHLLWDQEKLRLAIRPLTKGDKQAFKLTFYKGKRGATFSAQSFLKFIQWKESGSFTTPVHWNEKDGFLVADLPPERVGQPRKQR